MGFLQKHALLLVRLFRLGEFAVTSLLLIVSFSIFTDAPLVDSTWALLPFLVLLLAAYFVLAYRKGLYQSMRLINVRHEVGKSLSSYFLATSFSFLVVNLLHLLPPGSPRVLMLAVLVSTAGLMLYHATTRHMLYLARSRGYDRKIAVCVGINRHTEKIISTIRERPEVGVDVVGVSDQDESRRSMTSHPYLGDIDQLEAYLRSHVVDIVFITLPIRSCFDQIMRIIRICSAAGIEVRYQLNILGQPLQQGRTTRFAGEVFITFDETPLRPCWVLAKRAFDLAASLALTILLSPLMIAAALAVWVTSGGPIFFKQIRVGYHGRRFVMFKFRTMVNHDQQTRGDLAHLNEVAGPVFKMRRDPRVTPVGKVLRRLSIDELPQLFNVIDGDMSLVGPRPPLPNEVDQYQWKWRRRLSIRPGLTCTWQVSGRNEVSFKNWMDMDLSYIDNWTPLLDLEILLKTIPAVLSGRGAY